MIGNPVSMQIHETFQGLLSSPARLRVLRTLLRGPPKRWTGRELSRAAGTSQSQTQKALELLESNGLTWREVVGRADCWQLSGEHVLLDPLRQLFKFEGDVSARLQRDLGRGLAAFPIRRAVLFGSVSGHQENPGSDVDLFIEVRSARERRLVEKRLTPMTVDLARRYGNVLAPLVYTAEEVRAPPNPRLMAEITEHGIELELR